jgi:hypothetical protein
MNEATRTLHEFPGKLQGFAADAVMTEARGLACKAVKAQCKTQGLKPAHIKRKIFVAAARDYLRHHPELRDQAAHKIKSCTEFRALAERIERGRAKFRSDHVQRARG